jgi:hypothetical protein
MTQDRPAALVTGSASGIELGSLGGRHLALRADVSDDAAVAALAGEIAGTFGRLDALARPSRTATHAGADFRHSGTARTRS